jgi:hypothetical protein
MMIDLEYDDLIESVKTLTSLKKKIEEGKNLLKEDEN